VQQRYLGIACGTSEKQRGKALRLHLGTVYPTHHRCGQPLQIAGLPKMRGASSKLARKATDRGIGRCPDAQSETAGAEKVIFRTSLGRGAAVARRPARPSCSVVATQSKPRSMS
jgi:hypothetical protein